MSFWYCADCLCRSQNFTSLSSTCRLRLSISSLVTQLNPAPSIPYVQPLLESHLLHSPQSLGKFFTLGSTHPWMPMRCSAGQKGVLPALGLLTGLLLKQPGLCRLTIQSSRSVRNDGLQTHSDLEKLLSQLNWMRRSCKQVTSSLGRAGVTGPGKQHRARGMLLAKAIPCYRATWLWHTCWNEISFLPSHPSPPFSVPWLSPSRTFFKGKMLKNG